MSLLLDAMKRAEQARRQAEASAAEHGAMPAAEAGPTTPPAPELALAEPAPPPPRPAPTLPGTSRSGLEAANREAAQLLFEAKEPSRDRRRFYAALALATTVAAAALGAWVWWQMQARSSLGVPAGAPAPRAAEAPPRLPEPPPVAAAPAPAIPPAHAAAPAVRPAELAPPAADPVPAQAVVITRTPRTAIPPDVAAGYQALAAGEVEAARRHYQAALRAEPRNVDALHGLAAIALRDGRPGEAADLYRRIVELSPRDAAAQSALASLAQDEDAESSLRALLAAAPDAPATRFALGNALAARQRWREAQQAYFEAHTGDPANPDYLLNLAVSLDQLHQADPAAQYYRRALEAARERPAAFDAVAVAARLAALEEGR